MPEGLERADHEKRPDGGLGERLASTERTVDEVLSSSRLIEANERAAHAIDRNLAHLRAETGLEEDEVVRVPVLFRSQEIEGERKAIAFLPNAVDGVHLSAGTFLAPKQHAPVVGGRDLMQSAVEEALGWVGVRVRWVEDLYIRAQRRRGALNHERPA